MDWHPAYVSSGDIRGEVPKPFPKEYPRGVRTETLARLSTPLPKPDGFGACQGGAAGPGDPGRDSGAGHSTSGSAEHSGEGDAALTPRRILPLMRRHRSILGRPLRTRPTSALGRKQHVVLSFRQDVMETQQRRWLKYNTASQHARWVHEKGA